MQRTIIAAAVLLLMQIALAVALNMTGSQSRDVSPAAPLFGFAPDTVTALDIAGPSGERLTIRKTDAGWILPEHFDAPASGEQVNGLLAKLADLKQGLAVATSDEAAKRFKVTETVFERHVVVKKGEETVADLYVGTSPGFRQVQARKAGAPEIVTVALNTFDLETAADKWLDKNLFRLKQEEMDALVFAGFTLQKKDKNWQLAGLEEGKETAKDGADDLVNGVSGLTIQDVMNPKEAAALFAGEPALSFTVNLKNGSKLEYRFAKPSADYFVVKRSDRELYGKVHTVQVENLRKYSREKLIKQENLPAVESGQVEGAEGLKGGMANEPPETGESKETEAPKEANPAQQ